MSDMSDIRKAALEAKRKMINDFFATAKTCLDQAGAMFDLAVKEVIEHRWETGAIAANMAIKMYAAKKYETGEAKQRFELAKKNTDWWQGCITINNITLDSDYVQNLTRTDYGHNAFLMAGASLDPYLLLGACYYSFYPQQFLAYNIPYRLLTNYCEHLAGKIDANPDFTSDYTILRIIDTVGFIFAAMNCPEKFPVPWTLEEKEAELKTPLNWSFFKE